MMRSFEVKYGKEKKDVQADSLQEFKTKVCEAFSIDEKSLKITKPLLKDQNAFQNTKEKVIAVIGTKTEVKAKHNEALYNSKKPKGQINPIAQNEICQVFGEGCALFYLLTAARQLLSDKYIIDLQKNGFAWFVRRTLSRMISPDIKQPVKFLGIAHLWVVERIQDDIGTCDRFPPEYLITQFVEYMGRDYYFFRYFVKHLILFRAKYEALNIINMQTDKPDKYVVAGKENIISRQRGYLPIKAYTKYKDHLNQLFQLSQIQLRAEQQFTDTEDHTFDEKFLHFVEPSTYLFLFLNRIQPPDPDLKPNDPKLNQRIKRTYPIAFPKYIDIYDMCEDRYKERIAAPRKKLMDFISRNKDKIQEEKLRLNKIQLNDMQAAFSAFQNGLMSEQSLNHMLYECDDRKNVNCHTGVYRLVGFVTYTGGLKLKKPLKPMTEQQKPSDIPPHREWQQPAYATVVETDRKIWYYCKGSKINKINEEQVFSNYNGSTSKKPEEVETADLLMWRKVHIADDHQLK